MSKDWAYAKPDTDTLFQIRQAAETVFQKLSVDKAFKVQVSTIVDTLRERHPVWRQNFLEVHENGAKSKLFKAI